MARHALGEFEHLILLAILRLGDDAYGVSILSEVEERTNRRVSQAATYIALQRLEKKALVAARIGEASDERGGRAKRYFEVTEAGRERLRSAGGALFAMWDGLDPSLRADSA